MRWDLHGVTIAGRSNNADLRRLWQQSFASCPPGSGKADVRFSLDVVPALPAAPAGEPQYQQGDLLAYTVHGDQAIAHFPRYGQLVLELSGGETRGRIGIGALQTYGVLEDLIAIGLSPHLRRRGLFLLHAFAAAHRARAVLLVGDMGAGKTTTGMALLHAGWKLLSNDSPIIAENGPVLSYPGLLAAYADTFARFPGTADVADARQERRKHTVAAEAIWPGVWQERAPAGAICFPSIGSGKGHALEPLSAPQTLRRLLPHAVEQWDRDMIPAHLAVLRRLVESAPGYVLRLGPDVQAIPQFLADALGTDAWNPA